jgi:hypothetical protein
VVKQQTDRLELSVDTSYTAKIAKHRDICRKAGMLFEPLTFDAGGFIHENSPRSEMKQSQGKL